MDLGARVLSALRWTAIARFSGQLISWAATIIVIRLVAPGEYGLMAVAAAVLALVILCNTVGLDAVLIQHRALDHALRRQIFGAVIVLNILCFVAVFAAAPLLANFFEEPRLTAVLRVMSAQFLILVFETMPQTALERELDFKRKSLVDLCTIVLGSLVTLAGALLGTGIWALVAGYLATVATRVAGFNLIAPFRAWPTFSLSSLGPHVRFGSFVTSERALWVIHNEADKFIGGKLMSQQSLGHYAVAMHVASLPISKLGALLNSVAFPAFSQVQHDVERVGSMLLKGVRLLSFGAFPVFVGLAALAPEIVGVLFGPTWEPAAIPLQIGALVMPLRMLGNFMSSFLWGIGRPQISAGNLLLAAIVMPIAFVIGAPQGPVGLALAWLCAYPLVFAICLLRTLRAGRVALRSFLASMIKPAAAAAVMFGVVLQARPLLMTQSALLRMTALIFLGAAVYVALTLLADRATWRELFEITIKQRQRAVAR